MEEWVTLLSNFGFPVVLSIYLLLRFERKLDQLIDSLEQMNQNIQFTRWDLGKHRKPFD
ncbi:YvrJ family protein [Rubeoparvulum massiliense]|uniref:YvrJ family protein n=1 Tax=Rubeoparvulum massiliense TaxID=1631346 RepID=UPI0009759190|nr:YvrJ family protein [Rubeoparvulum massiliense]